MAWTLFPDVACIFPARQGSQIGSSAIKESSVIPVTSFFFHSFLTSCRWWWASLLCHRSRSRGIVVAAEAYSARGAVVPSKNAAFESLMVAVNQMVPSGCLKDILLESMVTVNPFCWVRNRTVPTLVNCSQPSQMWIMVDARILDVLLVVTWSRLLRWCSALIWVIESTMAWPLMQQHAVRCWSKTSAVPSVGQET